MPQEVRHHLFSAGIGLIEGKAMSNSFLLIHLAILSIHLGIGQPLGLLLKQSAVITELALYDVVPVVKGVAADISHVDTPSIVTGYDRDDDGLKRALTGAHVVVIPAGVPRKVGLFAA